MGQDEREHAELMMLYQQATQDIRAIQDRQTLITNLSVAALAALIAIAPNKALDSGGSLTLFARAPTVRAQLPLLAFTLALGSVAWIVVLQVEMWRARQRIDRTSAHFSAAFKKASGKNLPTGRVASWEVAPLLIGAVLIVFLITLKILKGS